MKTKAYQKLLIYGPALLLFLFSLLLWTNPSKGDLIAVEGYYPYISTDIFGDYTYIASDQVIKDDQIEILLKDNPLGGSVYVAFEPSKEGALSQIKDISTVEQPGYLPGAVFQDEQNKAYRLQLNLNKVRLGSSFDKLNMPLGSDDGSSKYNYYFYQLGNQLVLESVKKSE